MTWRAGLQGAPGIFGFLFTFTVVGITVFALLLLHGSGVWAVFGMVVASLVALAGLVGSLLLAMFLDGFKKNMR